MSETGKKTEKKEKEISSSGPERTATAKPRGEGGARQTSEEKPSSKVSLSAQAASPKQRGTAAADATADHAPSKKSLSPAAANAAAPKQIRIRQVKSGICTPENHKQTLRALGLRRIRHEVVRPDTPTVRGQIHKVRHLVTVVEGA